MLIREEVETCLRHNNNNIVGSGVLEKATVGERLVAEEGTIYCLGTAVEVHVHFAVLSCLQTCVGVVDVAIVGETVGVPHERI